MKMEDRMKQEREGGKTKMGRNGNLPRKGRKTGNKKGKKEGKRDGENKIKRQINRKGWELKKDMIHARGDGGRDEGKK